MLLNVAGVHKSFAVDRILTGTSFRIERREKVALVGRNGTGKSTLLKIITGQMEPDTGSVALARGAKIGYLRQESPVDNSRTVLEEAEESRREALAIKARLEQLEVKLEHSPTDQELEEYATLHEHYMEMEGYSAERDLRTVLNRMGFDEAEMQKSASALSGGEKTRLALSRLLLEQPDLLLLDEPTNHLDLQATEWLEGWLREYPGAVLLVSHDRAFLNNFGDRILDLRDGVVKSYPGPYEKFVKLREEEEARQVEVARRQQIELDKMDEYVRRFMNSQRTAQARGRQKQMNKLIATAVKVPKADKNMAAGFKASHRSGEIALELEKLSMGFSEGLLFKDLNWVVRYGERWGVIGDNGSGKSTLIKCALGQLDPVGGKTRLGSQVVAGYFAQDTVTLDPEMSPLDTMVWEFDLLPADARNLLGRFLLTGDDVYRPIKTLSGGEKNKLVLASLTTLNPNLLILDEPTNHLDMASREALAAVLKDYTGTLILISHDRWLLEQVTDHTLDLRKSGAILFNGSYADYRRGVARVAPAAKSIAKEEEKNVGLSPRELSKEIGRLEKMVADLEVQIHDSEQDLVELENTLANLPKDADVFALTQNYSDLKESISGQMAVWEEKSLQLEEFRATQGK
ncbi:MAG TPA: ABC-F family ATP-binding cassette domain-containing protein [Fimbriimonadaceae bacterium]|jgi:ATP-binding cassette subfamily F protein 3